MLIDGTAIARAIHEELRHELASLTGRPHLTAVLVGDNPASHLYVAAKMRACEKVGLSSDTLRLPADTPSAELMELLNRLNEDPNVTGILVQLPLPAHLDPVQVSLCIRPEKDVDGINPLSYGKLLLGDPSGFVPCTPLGIQQLLLRSGFAIEGKHVVIAGRSAIVGKPLACLLMQKSPEANATVTVVHSHTPDIGSFSRQADILVAAIGQPEFFTADMVRPGAIVIDVGQNRIRDPATPKGYRLVGDVAFGPVRQICAAITPVPGGVGPMTIAMLLSNTLKAFKQGAEL